MGKTLTFRDVEVGDELGPMVKQLTSRKLVQWACLTQEFSERHYDKDFAQAEGLPTVIAHGAYLASLLGHLVTDWMGEKGVLKRLMSSFRHAHLIHEDCICKGKVVRKYAESDQNLVECEIWIENPSGGVTVRGSAIVAFTA